MQGSAIGPVAYAANAGDLKTPTLDNFLPKLQTTRSHSTRQQWSI